jgi:hypothetical protein
VREHTRSNGTVVKEHIRGLREFDWKGYHCVVTAPKFNGHLFTQMPIDPVEVDKDFDPAVFMSTEMMAERMAAMEDMV